MVVIIKKMFVYCFALIFASVVCLTGCGFVEIDYPYLHDKSEIISVEIVNAHYDHENDKGVQTQILVFTDYEQFLIDLESLKYGYSLTPGDPVGVVSPGIAVKIIYENGDYEVFRYSGRSVYTQDKGYDAYCDRGYFDKDEFNTLLSEYLGYYSLIAAGVTP